MLVILFSSISLLGEDLNVLEQYNITKTKYRSTVSNKNCKQQKLGEEVRGGEKDENTSFWR